jgi:hypothetical protein
MVYSPGIVLIRDDNGEWRSPVEVDVLTSAAVNAGEIRRGLEREERLRIERVEMEYWKRKGEERRKQNERIFAERQKRMREEAKKKKEKEELAKLKKEQAKSKKEKVKEKETDKGKAKECGGEKEEPIDKQEKAVAEVENENENEENEKGEQVEVEKQGKAEGSGGEREEPFDKQESAVAEVENENEDSEEVEIGEPEENQENTIDSPDNALENGSDSQLKGAEENTESNGTLIQDDQPQPEAPPEVNQEPISSVVHPLSPPTQPSQVPVPGPNLTYAHSLRKAEIQIEQTMYDRISRILHLFQLHQTPHLILGSFGTGVFRNRTDLIANIFVDLLIKPGARFKDVFKTVVFAILGKETVRVFSGIFLRANKRAQRERTGKTHVFVDSFGSEGDGDVREGDEEKTIRMMKWRARRRELEEMRNPFMNVNSDEAPITTSFDLAQLDAAFPPLSFGIAQDSAFSNPTSSTAVFDVDQADAAASSNAFQAGAAAYATSSNAFRTSTAAFAAPSNFAQASLASYPPFFDTIPSFEATETSEIPYPTSFTAASQPVDSSLQSNPTAVDYNGIPEDPEMILSRDDELVDFVAEATPNAPITPKDMVVDDGKNIETMETNSLPTHSHEALCSKSNKLEDDGDIEMQ